MQSVLRGVACAAAAIAFALPAHSDIPPTLGTAYETVIPLRGVLYDKVAGLDWHFLDTDSLPGTTWDQALSHAPGFRLATRSEAETFFAHVGIELTNSWGPRAHSGVTFFLQEWGTLSTTYWDNPESSPKAARSSFWLADAGSEPGTHLVGSFLQAYEEYEPGVPEFWQVSLDGSMPTHTSLPGLSAALVRIHVIPEPETYLMLVGGLAALLLRRSLGR